MIYEVLVANGEDTYHFHISEVKKVLLQGENQSVCVLADEDGTVLFSSPVDSLIYMRAE